MNQTEQDPDVAQIGRVLHFVIDKGHKLQCRPALVVEDWPEQGKPGYVNLVVFVDGSNDKPTAQRPNNTAEMWELNPTLWETSVMPNHAVRAHRSWHWPKECSHLDEPLAPYIGVDRKRYHHNHRGDVVDLHNCYGCMVKDSSKENVDAQR